MLDNTYKVGDPMEQSDTNQRLLLVIGSASLVLGTLAMVSPFLPGLNFKIWISITDLPLFYVPPFMRVFTL